MGHAIQKQYLKIASKTILQHTLEHLITSSLTNIVVTVAPTDEKWREMPLADHGKLTFVEGGDSRAASVLNGLQVVTAHQEKDCWVMVHDAVRPCVRNRDIENLIESVVDHSVGGLLATRTNDTLKKARLPSDSTTNEADRTVIEVERTVDRERYWCALTPQIFRLGMLHEAITRAIESDANVTDEASAVELLGLTPLLIEGSSDNIKVTHPEDLKLAEFYMSMQESEP
jgi:2-C-methyl-D-erythritol 4-phosphate cytidylyltransferase|tara:strand:+ start:3723 stop:4409 length:687 start_codon:yes stop_codon:yes gene_type:complete